MYGITPDALVNYNAWSDGINHPLFQGDEVKIPPNSKVPSATPDTRARPVAAVVVAASRRRRRPPETTTPAGGAVARTRSSRGDNPTRVANKYGITVDELAAANAGNPAYQNFLIGSSLSIPANGTC